MARSKKKPADTGQVEKLLADCAGLPIGGHGVTRQCARVRQAVHAGNVEGAVLAGFVLGRTVGIFDTADMLIGMENRLRRAKGTANLKKQKADRATIARDVVVALQNRGWSKKKACEKAAKDQEVDIRTVYRYCRRTDKA